MKILALDYGTKNIGLALTDDEGDFAFAYGTVSAETQNFASLQNAIDKLKTICQKEKVEKIIIGWPTQLSGIASTSTLAVSEFIKKLEEGIGLPIETIDERLSTMQAQKSASGGKNSTSIDALSAQILLSGYLEKISSTRL